MKVLVTGAAGQLGYDVCKLLQNQGVEYQGVDICDFDITNCKDVFSYIKEYNPTAVIHCSAYTAVDKAEEEPEKCFEINMNGTRNIAMVCKELNCKMLYISTDYVFNGNKGEPYNTNDQRNPQNKYGESKLEGERVVQVLVEKFFIVRISWVFGRNGNNFPKTMMQLGKEQEIVNVVADQIGSPTYTKDLALLLYNMIQTEKYGIYHATNEGECSWADFAEEIFKICGYKTKVNRITTEQYQTKAMRPKNSRLSKESLDIGQFRRLPIWQIAVSEYINELKYNSQ